MDCELCYAPYDAGNAASMPKVLKSCPHSYCQNCLLAIKEKAGKAQCPVCATNSCSEPEDLPNNL